MGVKDPLRVSLLERVQRAGVRLEPIVEVEFQSHSLELAAEEIGDAFVSYHVGRRLIEDRGLHWASLDPPPVQQNLVHGSDSPVSAQRELALWFG